jgi:hypothetical protein
MSKLIYSALAAAVFLAGVSSVSAQRYMDDWSDGYQEYEPNTTAADRAFWEQFNQH